MKLSQALYVPFSLLMFFFNAPDLYGAPNLPNVPSVLLCPLPSGLKWNDTEKFWYASEGWRSYGITFVKSVDTFLGAQWTGVNVGQATCLYQGKPEGTFVVQLVSNGLYHAPEATVDNHWGKPQAGYINCKSLDRVMCPLTPVYKKKSTDMIQEALDLKKDA